jgi:hypothetical protein
LTDGNRIAVHFFFAVAFLITAAAFRVSASFSKPKMAEYFFPIT